MWSFKYLPVQSTSAFDRFGEPYNYTRILTAGRDFDAAAYVEYSPLYLTAASAMTYMASMMLLTAAISHTVLFNGKGIYQALRGNALEKEDIHARLMKSYKQLSYWSAQPLASRLIYDHWTDVRFVSTRCRSQGGTAARLSSSLCLGSARCRSTRLACPSGRSSSR